MLFILFQLLECNSKDFAKQMNTLFSSYLFFSGRKPFSHILESELKRNAELRKFYKDVKEMYDKAFESDVSLEPDSFGATN